MSKILKHILFRPWAIFDEFFIVKKIHHVFTYNKNKYENFLDDPKCHIWNKINAFITFLVLLFIAVVTFESLWNNRETYAVPIYIFDAFISVVFALEYFYRFFRARKKIMFVFNPIRIIDLLSFLPFFLWLFTFGTFIVTLRLIRVLRILRLVKRIPLTSWFIHALKDYIDEYRAVFLLYFVVLFLGSFFVYFVEKDVPWTQFTSIPITLWWWLVTMTTVWFWDLIPITPLWKAFWSLIIFLWPLVIALATSVTIMVFQDANHRRKILDKSKKAKVCPKCKTKNFKDANYCFYCWSEFNKEKEFIKWE